METSLAQPPRYQQLAGTLCLDFANTADWHESEQPVELLTSYSDLLVWGQETGVIEPDEAMLLLRAAEYEPEATVDVYARAIVLREAIYRIFRSIARELDTAASDLTLLNNELTIAHRHRRVVADRDGYRWDWFGQEAALDRVLWEVTLSAAETLTSAELGRVRQCAGDPCGWLFYDGSRNRSRRWCNMEGCGNRAKARRYYERQRNQQGAISQ